MAKDAFYFTHDANARNDPKILQMRSLYKMQGLGIYWCFVEKMREQSDYRLSISGKYAIVAYAEELGVELETLKKFIDDCVNEFKDDKGGLFVTDGKYLWSESLMRRMALKDVASGKAREKAFKRWNKTQEQIQPAERPITPPKTASKDQKTPRFGVGNNVKLTAEEHQKLISQFGQDGARERIDRLSVYIGSKGVKYRSHYLTILNWETRDKGSSQPPPASTTNIEVEK